MMSIVLLLSFLIFFWCVFVFSSFRLSREDKGKERGEVRRGIYSSRSFGSLGLNGLAGWWVGEKFVNGPYSTWSSWSSWAIMGLMSNPFREFSLSNEDLDSGFELFWGKSGVFNVLGPPLSPVTYHISHITLMVVPLGE